MSASTKRAARPAASAAIPSPLTNALLVTAAISYGLWLLVDRGRMAWPPSELLSGTYTLAGCLALIGPVVLARRERSEGGLGELVWMSGGLLVWTYDLAAVVRGAIRSVSWATPLPPQTMGLTILAVLLAGLRLQGAGRSWSWTNVVGWLLGLFWVSVSLATFLPGGGPFRAGLGTGGA